MNGHPPVLHHLLYISRVQMCVVDIVFDSSSRASSLPAAQLNGSRVRWEAWVHLAGSLRPAVLDITQKITQDHSAARLVQGVGGY